MDAVAEKPAAQPLKPEDIRRIIMGVMLAMLLAALDQTIVATALPTIGRELGHAEFLSWVVTAYLVTTTAVTPLYGKIADIHGRRTTLLAGIVLFVLGSVACALAPTMLTLVLARALQGIGGGGLISIAQTIIGDIVAPRERGRYQVYIATVFASSSLAGPVLGGVFAEHLHWSFIFWINVPLGAAAFAMTYTLLKRLPRHERPHTLDFLGALILIAATTTLMLMLNLGGSRYPWLSGPVIGLGLVSLMLWVLFALRLGSASEPLIPLALFRNQVLRMGTLSACFGMGTFIAMSVYLPVFMELVKGFSASDSGLSLIPLMIGMVFGATTSGRLMTRITHYKRVPIVGLGLAVASMALMSIFAGTLSTLWLEVLLFIVSIGLGTLMPITTVAIQNAVPLHQLGIATASMNFFRNLGGALLIAFYGVILLSGGIAAGLHGAEAAGQAGADPDRVLTAFRTLFGAGAIGLLFSLGFIALMEERPFLSHAERKGG